MNSKDIEKIIRWSVDSDLKKFSEDAYGITGTAFDKYDDYLRDKFRQMKNNFIMWISGLSENNRERLAKNISSYIDERRGRVTFDSNPLNDNNNIKQ
jgi:hypothetical protein